MTSETPVPMQNYLTAGHEEFLNMHSVLTHSIHTCMHMHACKPLTQVKQCGTDFSPHPLQYRAVSMATSSSFWH